MRVQLSSDPDAKELLSQVKQAATMLGMNPADVNPQFYEGLKNQVSEMINALD